MLQRLTLIIRLQRDSTVQDWCGQVEMVNPHREAAFQNRRELWALLEKWIERPVSEASHASEDKTPPVGRV